MADKNQLRIEQSEKNEGDDWWSWSVWIDGGNEHLEGVDSVEYTLHPTFPNPVRTVRTRRNGFKLSTEGWGVFPVFARVVKKDGSVVRLKHQLTLTYPGGKLNTK